MQSYNYDESSASSAAGVLAIFGVMLIPVIIVSVITLIGQWKVFVKAGKPGWACIIPIYNLIVLLEIAGKPVWWIILFLIPCVNFIFIIWTINLVAKSFGQSEGFTIGLLLLGFIFWPVLGFGNYTYLGPAGAEGQAALRQGNPFNKDPFNTPPPPPGFLTDFQKMIYKIFCSRLVFIGWLQNHLIPCPFKFLTGLDCPGCGFQRAVIALVQGNIAKSLAFYPAAVPLLLFFTYGIADRLVGLDNAKGLVKKTAFIIIGSLILVSYCLKMWHSYAVYKASARLVTYP